ncbi:MAG TPA: hypothetical protein VEI96_04020, partial [Thermodesulfovibrionales bacterium]|nr:hypothetical protein [Thermodesulfovibrionales bacterium]
MRHKASEGKTVNPVRRLSRYLPLFLVLVIWQVLSTYGVIPENRLPSPLLILRGIKELLTDGLPPGYHLAGHCLGSLKRVLSGVAAAVLTALPLGIAMGYSGKVRDFLTPFVEIVRP